MDRQQVALDALKRNSWDVKETEWFLKCNAVELTPGLTLTEIERYRDEAAITQYRKVVRQNESLDPSPLEVDAIHAMGELYKFLTDDDKQGVISLEREHRRKKNPPPFFGPNENED